MFIYNTTNIVINNVIIFKWGLVIDIVILIVTGTVVVVLLILLLMVERYGRRGARFRSSLTPPLETSKTTKCPLCGSDLTGNRRVKSVLFPGKPDSMMEINGCPFCYPVNSDIVRICPVCKKEVPKDGHVIARVFIKPAKKHVHVLGCTGCYKRKSP